MELSDDIKALIMEFFGTFMLVYTIGMGAPAIGVGAILMAMIYAGATTSGGHYNPSVSLAMLVNGQIDAQKFGKYVVAQFLGGLLASAMAYWLVPEHASVYFNGIANGANDFQGLLVEIVFSFNLIWVIMWTTDSKREGKNEYFAWCIGMAVTVGAGSGAVMNACVALTLDAGHNLWTDAWILAVGPLVGGALGAFAYKVVSGMSEDSIAIKLVHEAVGTAFLCLAIGMTGDAYAIGLMLALQIAVASEISGGMLNPSVSLSQAIRKQLEPKDCGLYMAAQFGGAFIGSMLAWELCDGVKDMAYPTVADGEGNFEATVAELITTAALVFTVAHVTAESSPVGNFFFMAIGFVVMAGAYSGGQYTGGAFNSAVGLALPALKGKANDIAVYVLGPLLGGAVGGGLSLVLPPKDGSFKEMTPQV